MSEAPGGSLSEGSGAGSGPAGRAGRLAAISALEDPARRAVYDLVCRRDEPIGRDEAAAALGVSRRSVAFHLDRLAELGLLAVQFRRLTGRTGPGAGRPAKLYSASVGEVGVSVPERHYDLAAEVMAAAIERSAADGEPVGRTMARVAAERGRELGAAARRAGVADLVLVLQEQDFAPVTDADGGVLLANCPFHRLAERHTGVVCGLNLDLIRGIASGLGDDLDGTTREILLDPIPGHCCVRLPAQRP